MKAKGHAVGGTWERIESTYLSDAETRRRVEELTAKITIRQDLIALRKKRGLTQKHLADRMGVSQPTVAVLESAAPRNIELHTLFRAAVALGAQVRVTLEEFPGETGKARAIKKKAA